MDRLVNWTACVNVRDLGGLRTASDSTRWRSIIRSDNLSRLDQHGREQLLNYGIRTVIDLRDRREVEKYPYAFTPVELGATIVNAPLISDENWKWYAAQGSAATGYVEIPRLSTKNIVDALRAVAAAPSGAVVVHCHEGRERTGVIAAILLELADVSDPTIADDWVASLPGSLKPEDILAVLDYMRQNSGSVTAFLLEAGLRRREIDALRERLVD